MPRRVEDGGLRTAVMRGGEGQKRRKRWGMLNINHRFISTSQVLCWQFKAFVFAHYFLRGSC